MKVTHQVHPTPEQAAAFFSAEEDGPMCMVNLLKFKEKAEYADGSEPELSGRAAYMRYGMAVQACFAAVGARSRFWDMVAIAEYPSRAAMLQMIQSPEYQAITRHRDAGLAGQLNIRTKAIGG